MALRTPRGECPDPAARLRALTRRAYAAGSGHLDFDSGQEFDRIIRGDPVPGDPGGGDPVPGDPVSSELGPAAPSPGVMAAGRHRYEDRNPDPVDSAAGDPTRRVPPGGRALGAHGPAGPGSRREVRSPRRWAVSARAAAVVLAVVAALTGIIVIRSFALGPGPPVAVPEREGEVVSPAAADPAGGAGGPAAEAESGADPAAVESADSSEHPAGTGADGGAEAGVAGSRHSGDGGTAHVDPGASPVVHVAGAVASPGIVELRAGARVAEAIEAAGGATSDAELAAVNLARPVTDGEQVYVPRVGEVEPGTAAGLAAGGPAGADPGQAGGQDAGGAGDVVDLNTADQARLETLPGVGPAIAQRILEWRAQHGPFHTVDELLEVSGIGPTILERLRERVRV